MPGASNQPFTSFPTNFITLPTISFVIPNPNNDMHDGTISQAALLQNNLGAYIQFVKTNNSLLIVTWDEDDGTMLRQIFDFVRNQNKSVRTHRSEQPAVYSVADQTMRWWLYPLFAKAAVMASEWLQPLVSMVRSITVSPTLAPWNAR